MGPTADGEGPEAAGDAEGAAAEGAPGKDRGEEEVAQPGQESGAIATGPEGGSSQSDVRFVPYKDETDMPGIVELIEKDLSEPYSIFTYRYFINNWPELCFLTMQGDSCVGAIVCKLDVHRSRSTHRGYIAMLAVEKSLRGRGIGSKLVGLCLDKMREMGADECVLETEVTNTGAIGLYRNVGFVKEKRLHKYYLNGNDAFRLKFLFKLPEGFDRGEGCLGPPTLNWEVEAGTF
uniref:N-acetyltransferase domain-containing protein n=1 Tax=Alexandrium catenella TaxID=2925 RepID=A0A7S1S8P1_ALECA